MNTLPMKFMTSHISRPKPDGKGKVMLVMVPLVILFVTAYLLFLNGKPEWIVAAAFCVSYALYLVKEWC